MRKTAMILMLGLVLCTYSFAMATSPYETFSFTAEEYIAGFSESYNLAMNNDVLWIGPFSATDILDCWIGLEEGMGDVFVYAMTDDPACCCIFTEGTFAINADDNVEKSIPFGVSFAAIITACRYVELNYDVNALVEELPEITAFYKELVMRMLSNPDEIQSALLEGKYSITDEYAGHSIELVLEVDKDTNTIIQSLFFMP